MPQDAIRSREQWLRYVYARDTGHTRFIRKANRCEDFVAGEQWSELDRTALRIAKRPALTINKTLITLASITGEQLNVRNEVSFRPRTGSQSTNAEIFAKIFKFIGAQNQLDWVRTGVFTDGAVTSRGYYDVRLDFSKNLAGDIAITQLNPRMVLPDPDGTEYDPDKWSDIIVTAWHTPDTIEILYGKDDADILRARVTSAWSFGFDSIDIGYDRFGGGIFHAAEITEEMRAMMRNIRVIERQHRVLTRQKIFVDARLGIKRDIPDTWSRDQIALMVQQNPNLIVSDELVKRIKWTVTADDLVLLDVWSPYKHFTVVPYFPVFRTGRTVGLIEGLLDPQELLNKTISQELHVVNTMANSGWKVRSGTLLNMTMEELEDMGAKTGLVLEVNGDPDKDIVKILPNPIPQGLDRISFKAENFIKSISSRGDSVMGLDRADVSGKAIGEKKQSAEVPLRPALDNLERTDWMMARNVMDIIQQYWTDPRILNVTHDDLTGEMEQVSINMPQPGSGELLNDLSLGEFDIVIVSQAAKRTLEESQFEQAIAMKELGIPIPPRFLIENSNLVKKAEIVKAMEAEAQSEGAQIREKADLLTRQLDVANLKADATLTESKAVATKAKAAKDIAEASASSGGQDTAMILEKQKHDQEMQLMREKADLEMKIKREEAALKLQLADAEAKEKARQAKIQTMMQMKQAAATPGTVDEAAKLAKAGGPARKAA